MLTANLHLRDTTRITYQEHNGVHWVELDENGQKLAIYTKTAKDAKELVQVLWVIREHLHPLMRETHQGGFSAASLMPHMADNTDIAEVRS